MRAAWFGFGIAAGCISTGLIDVHFGRADAGGAHVLDGASALVISFVWLAVDLIYRRIRPHRGDR